MRGNLESKQKPRTLPSEVLMRAVQSQRTLGGWKSHPAISIQTEAIGAAMVSVSLGSGTDYCGAPIEGRLTGREFLE